MDLNIVRLFIKFCATYAAHRSFLNPTKQKAEELISLLEECLAVALFLNDTETPVFIYFVLGNLYHLVHPEAANPIDYFKNVLSFMTGNHALGDISFSIGEYYKAIEHYQKSLSIAKQTGDRQGEGAIYGNLGLAYQSLGEYHKAIECHEKTLAIAKEIGDRQREGNAYVNLGSAYRSLGKYHEAIEYHEKSLSIAKEIGDRQGEGNTYGNLGIAYYSLGEYHKAIEYHEKRLSIAKEIGDRQGEGDTYGNLGTAYKSLGQYHKAIDYYEKALSIAKEIGNRQGEGDTYGNLGTAYYSLGEYHKAIEYHEKRLSIAKEIADKQGEGVTYGNLGVAYYSIGEYHNAIEYHEKRLSIAKEIGDRQGKGVTYGNLGVAYYSLGEYRKAIEYQEKSLSIAKEIGDRQGEGATYGNLGNDYNSLGEYHKAIEYFEKGLSIAKEIGDRQEEGGAYGNLGIAYNSLGEYHKAIEYYEKSLNIAIEIEDREGQALSHYNTGVAYEEESSIKDLSKSKEHLKKSIQCYEKLFDGLKDNDQFKVSIVDTFIKTYKKLSQVYIKTRQSDEALLACEHGRARALRDLLSLKYKTTEKTESKELELADVKTMCSYREVSILFYNLHYNKVTHHSWVISSRDPSTFFYDEIDNREALTTIMSSLSEDERKNADAGSYFQCLDVLFQRLVSPVLHHLTHDEVIIIPDGPLFMVPFAALQDPMTGKYLSETKCIRLAPSLTTLKILQESSHDQHGESGAVIIGNPTGDLPGAEKEAVEIGDLLGVQPLIGKQATKEVILEKLKQGVSVIHFAAHGSKERGQILLAPSNPTMDSCSAHDKGNMLTMKEAQESGIRAQLVVLSYCHSGRGDIRSEGVVGIARAFLAAGARAVVASLWAINDTGTKLFMLKFYSHLKNGESASKSLQQAMKEMREIERYKEPKYWAAFFLIGDDVTITG